MLIPFSANYQIYNNSGSVESNCQGILFINLGTDTVTVLGYPMAQGQQVTVPCNIGEIDRTNYNVVFSNTTTDQRLLVIRKNY